MEKLQSLFYKGNLIINTEKPMAMSFHTRQNRNLLKPQAKFNNMGMAYKSEFKFVCMFVYKYNRKYEMECSPEVTNPNMQQSILHYRIFKGSKEPTCHEE
jgi:hypothetical protein